MTDKQIITDGHDVSKGNQKYMKESSPVENWYKAKINTVDGINLAECVHFTRQVDFGYCELSNDSCNEFQYNCVKNKNCYFKQLKRKQQECEELKAENNTYKSSIVANLDKSISKRYRELLEENDQLKETNEGLLSIQYKLADNNKQLRQTLAEIKEIAEDFYLDGEYVKVKYLAQDILQKINEVENEKI